MTSLEAGASPARPAPRADDLEHLRLLALFHYVVAGIAALLSLLPGLQLVIGLLIATGRLEAEEEGAEIVGWVMSGCALFFMVLGLSFAALIAVTGQSLARRRWYTFCLVVATTLCLAVPLGTLLGVFTILVLVRPSVKALFEESGGGAPAVARHG